MSLKKEFGKLKKKIRLWCLTFWYLNFKYRNFMLFYPPQGSGDILLLCLYLKEYKKIYTNKKVGIVITKRSFFQLVNLFKEFVDEIILVQDIKEFPLIYQDMYNIVYNENDKSDNMREGVRKGLGLLKSSKVFVPSKVGNIKVKNFFDEINYEGKPVIFIVPDAVSCPDIIADEYWLALADVLAEDGFLVVFNSVDNKRFGEYLKSFMSIEDTIDFAKLCKGIVGYRSGLFDILSVFCDVPKVCFYPDWDLSSYSPLTFWWLDSEDNVNNRFLNCCSLKKMYDDNVEEYVFCSKKEEFLQQGKSDAFYK